MVWERREIVCVLGVCYLHTTTTGTVFITYLADARFQFYVCKKGIAKIMIWRRGMILMFFADVIGRLGRGMWRHDDTEAHAESAVLMAKS